MSSPSKVSWPLSVLTKWLTVYLLSFQAVFHVSDGAMEFLFQFLRTFLFVLGKISSHCTTIAQFFPKSLYRAKQTTVGRVTFKRYVVCRKCHQLYHIQDCIKGGSIPTSKRCPFKQFPDHIHAKMRKECECLLMKRVELSNRKFIHYPFLTYCYMSLKESIQNLFNRPKFAQSCEHWRTRLSSRGMLKDVYDGKVWQEFVDYEGQPFLSQYHNLALMLNMDFFQPFKHINYSVGAIYAVVMNLPRAIRYRQENVILVGLMPGPHEPKHNINSFIEPMVTELLELWEGVEMNISCVGRKVVRCALLCIGCDLPAGRKICGFLGHNARYGCSRCYKPFPGSVGNMDYSGFLLDTWPPRTGTDHRTKASRLQNFTTLAEQQDMESQYGCRYSVLLRLPYYDAPRMLIIDPMHNLFLGTAKYFLKNALIGSGLITDHLFDTIQQRINSVVVPTGIGRIPHKIRSGFSAFTADQWKNWVLYYSLLVLHDILNNDHLECWRHFVLACRALCCKELSSHQLQLGHGLLGIRKIMVCKCL